MAPTAAPAPRDLPTLPRVIAPATASVAAPKASPIVPSLAVEEYRLGCLTY